MLFGLRAAFGFLSKAEAMLHDDGGAVGLSGSIVLLVAVVVNAAVATLNSSGRVFMVQKETRRYTAITLQRTKT